MTARERRRYKKQQEIARMAARNYAKAHPEAAYNQKNNFACENCDIRKTGLDYIDDPILYASADFKDFLNRSPNYMFTSVEHKYWDRVFENGSSIIKVDTYGKPEWKGLTGLGNLLDKALKRSLSLDFEVQIQAKSAFELYEEKSVTTHYRVSYDSLSTTQSEVLKIGSPVPTGNTKWVRLPNTSSSSITDFRVCAISCESLLD